MFLQACLNGGRAAMPGLPLTADALAEDARAVRAAGADALHVHPRLADGAETLAPDVVNETLNAIRAAVPGMPVGLGTGAWISPGGRARHAVMAAWEEMPDYVSINLNEEDAFDVMGLMASFDVGIEAGVWSVQDAKRLANTGGSITLTRVLIEMPDIAAPVARADAMRCRAILRDAGITAPILLHGDGQSAWPCLIDAARQGLQMRIGFEDVLDLPDGTRATSNAQMITIARELIAQVQKDA